MTMTNDYDVWLKDFDESYEVVNGIRTAIYSASKVDKGQRTVLFVHGINGDYHGLVPVAYELRDDCRVVFVDLPGHGRSTIPSVDNAVLTLQDWSRQLVGALRRRGFDISVVVGHSFGAYVAQETGVDRLGLLNPPFAASTLSRLGTFVISRTIPIVGSLYRAYPVMVYRGNWLMHKRTKSTDMIVQWSSRLTHISKAQFKFQSRFADAVSTQKLMNISQLATVPKLVIVMSKYDRVVDNTSVPIEQLAQAVVVTVPTDHVSVTEVPARIADELRYLCAA